MDGEQYNGEYLDGDLEGIGKWQFLDGRVYIG